MASSSTRDTEHGSGSNSKTPSSSSTTHHKYSSRIVSTARPRRTRSPDDRARRRARFFFYNCSRVSLAPDFPPCRTRSVAVVGPLFSWPSASAKKRQRFDFYVCRCKTLCDDFSPRFVCTRRFLLARKILFDVLPSLFLYSTAQMSSTRVH